MFLIRNWNEEGWLLGWVWLVSIIPQLHIHCIPSCYPDLQHSINNNYRTIKSIGVRENMLSSCIMRLCLLNSHRFQDVCSIQRTNQRNVTRNFTVTRKEWEKTRPHYRSFFTDTRKVTRQFPEVVCVPVRRKGRLL